MKLTTNHSMSSYGIPIFVDDENNPMNYNAGVKTLRKLKGWSTSELAEVCGVSHRTVEGWEMGRLPGKQSLIIMQGILEKKA